MLKNFLSKDKLYKHVFTLVKGTVLAQVIGILAQPLLRRLYTPEEFGVYALYVAVISIFSIISTGRFDMAIVLPKKNEEAQKLFNLSIIISFLFSLLLFILLFFIGDIIIEKIIEKEFIDKSFQSQINWLKLSIYLLPVGIFLLSIINVLNYWFTREEKYNDIVKSKISNSFTNVGSTTALGYSSFSFLGILIGYIIGNLTGVLYFFYLKSKQEKLDLENVSYKSLVHNYKDFPTKSLFSGLLNMLASQLPIILIGTMFGAAILGFYELIIRVLNIPLTMVGRSISQVFYKKISEDIKNEKEIGEYVRSFSIKLLLLMLVPMSIIFFFGENVFAFLFGEDYRISGELAAYFSLFFLIRFVYYSQSTLYTAKRKLGIELKQNLIYLLTQILGLILGFYYFNDYKTTFILLAMGGFLCYLFFMISLLKLAKNNQ